MNHHLPLVQNCVSHPPRVPYLGDICRYDSEGFASFPARKGWKLVSEDAYSMRLVRSDGSENSVEEGTAFLQAWLYFGLLQDIFRTVGIEICLDDFMGKDHLGSFITSTKLPTYLDRWQQLNNVHPQQTQRQDLRFVFQLLHEAGDTVDQILSFPWLRYGTDMDTQIRLAVAESITMLGDSLMNAAKRIWLSFQDDIQQLVHRRIRKTLRFSEPATMSLKRLEHLGWCKSARMMLHRLVDTTGLYYAAMIPRPAMRKDHFECTREECVKMQINKETYRTLHVLEDCTCPVVELNRDEINKVIREGGIPSVRYLFSTFEPTSYGKVEIINAGTEYVAFSHVWAHGLGNVNVNGLPHCQLRRLQSLVDKLQEQLAEPRAKEARVLGFWIDTLCIPVGDEYTEARQKAIVSLTEVFQEAKAVLVVDAEVMDVSIHVSDLEKEIRLITCDWMRRVWTLQEALVAKREQLFWQFKEKALNADQIWGHDPSHQSDINWERCPNRITYRESAFDKRLPLLRYTPNDPEVTSLNFLEILYALRYRSLSRTEDETICIAPMLGFDRAVLVRIKDLEERIHRFLSLWEKVPSYLLFMEGERSSKPGRRWMPISFVRGIHKSVALRARPQWTDFDEKGIYVTHPGLKIYCRSETDWLHLAIGFCSPLDNRWYMIKDQGKFDLELPETQRWAYWREKLHDCRQPALILELPSDYPDYTIGVLVDIDREHHNEDEGCSDGHGSIIHAKYLCRVWLDDCEEDQTFKSGKYKDIGSWTKLRYDEAVRKLIGLAGEVEKTFEDVASASPPHHGIVECIGGDQHWCIG